MEYYQLFELKTSKFIVFVKVSLSISYCNRAVVFGILNKRETKHLKILRTSGTGLNILTYNSNWNAFPRRRHYFYQSQTNSNRVSNFLIKAIEINFYLPFALPKSSIYFFRSQVEAK